MLTPSRNSSSLLLVVCAALLFVQGCTLYFKGKDLELKTERQRIYTYNLEKANVGPNR